MNFDAWHENYSKLYQVKVFPETWEIFSIDSSWEGKTFGGRNYSQFFILLLISMPRKKYGN